MNKKYSVLIVEDDSTLRGQLNEAIGLYFNCKAASNVDEALSILGETKVDVIVSDILMPGKSGLHLVKTIRHNAFFNDIPILILSGLDADEHIKKGYEAGAVDYMTKPFKISLLIDKLTALINYRANLIQNPITTHFRENKEFIHRSKVNNFDEKLEKIISEKYDDANLNVNEIAEMLNISVSTLQRNCRKTNGSTVNKMIIDYRLRMAEMMIFNSNLSLSEVAICSGFNSLQYFSKSFKLKFGMYPSQYKKNHKKL